MGGKSGGFMGVVATVAVQEWRLLGGREGPRGYLGRISGLPGAVRAVFGSNRLLLHRACVSGGGGLRLIMDDLPTPHGGPNLYPPPQALPAGAGAVICVRPRRAGSGGMSGGPYPYLRGICICQGPATRFHTSQASSQTALRPRGSSSSEMFSSYASPGPPPQCKARCDSPRSSTTCHPS